MRRPVVGALRNAQPLVVGSLLVIGRQFAREIAVEVLLGHHIGAPGCDAAGAIVDRAEHLGAGRVGVGLQTVAAGGRAGNLHFGVGGDAAVELAVAHDLPFAVVLPDLDDGAAMRGHLDVDLLLGQRSLLDLFLAVLLDDLDDAGEHQVRIGVFVVDHQQAVLGRSLDRNVADIVVVVAELLGLGRRPSGSAGRTPARRQRSDRPSAAARRRHSRRRRGACRRCRPRPRRR